MIFDVQVPLIFRLVVQLWIFMKIRSIYFLRLRPRKENESSHLELYTKYTKQYLRKIRRKDRFLLNLSRHDTVQLYSRPSKGIKKGK